MQKYENLVDLENPEKNEYLVAIVAVDTAENEPLKVWGWFHSFFIRLLKAHVHHDELVARARQRVAAEAPRVQALEAREHARVLGKDTTE